MKTIAGRAFITQGLIILSLFIFGVSAFGQARCLTETQAQEIINSLDKPQNFKLNKSLQRELLDMQEERQKLDRKILDDLAKSRKLIPAAYELGEKQLLRVCEIIKQNGWLTTGQVGEEGVAAMLFLIKSNKAVELQKQIFPVIVAAAKKSLIGNGQVAALIDLIRVSQRAPQIFGTQSYVRNNLFYLYPLQNEARVDEWRKLYDLPPLAAEIRAIQSEYQMAVLKSPRTARAAPQREEKEKNQTAPVKKSSTGDPLNAFEEEEEVLKVESSLVNLNVRVYNRDSTPVNLDLQKGDFVVLEDGKPQEVEFFSNTEAPFDLVLLLDLSGSTSGKQDLIRKSTERFIEAARPNDRIAIVTFTNGTKVVSDLTSNKEQLLRSVEKIDDDGGSEVWGAIESVYDKILNSKSPARRSAIVFMTDGVDSSLLPGGIVPPNYPTFSDVLETVRNSDAAVLPIYLDTESSAYSIDKRAYPSARRTLQMLAEETGGQVYYAKKLNDLNGIYENIINDLGKVYSLGYQPTNAVQDGSWRTLTIKIPAHPNLIVRAKPGYYAR